MESNMREKFLEFIQAVIKRPSMYQIERVEDIWVLTYGYQHALIGYDNDLVTDVLSEFRIYVNKHYKTKSDFSWARLIRFHSGSNSHTIQIFAELFGDFIKSKGYTHE